MAEPQNQDVWLSPDGRIKKKIIIAGKGGLKPTEGCRCRIRIGPMFFNHDFNFSKSHHVIGESDDAFERLLDIVLTMMNVGEISDIIFKIKNTYQLNFSLELIEFLSIGLIFEWDAESKFKMALMHKSRGVELFTKNRHVDASHRFSKAAKLLCSIPIDVEEKPQVIDTIPLDELNKLKLILFNNLSSCYIKESNYEDVIILCKKVLTMDEKNIKAMYRLGIAYEAVHDYDNAFNILRVLLSLEPGNKAAIDKLKVVQTKVHETNLKVNTIIKKMFS